jgi:hypothetical protein
LIHADETREGRRIWWRKCNVRNDWLGEERKANPNFNVVYHVMNRTCIHLRAKGPNIYMYRRERIYKKPPGEIQ